MGSRKSIIQILGKTQCLWEDEFSENEFLGRICICENLFPGFLLEWKIFPSESENTASEGGVGIDNDIVILCY